MNVDIVQRNRDLRRYGEKPGFGAFSAAALMLLLVVSVAIYYREASAAGSGLALQGSIAAGIRSLGGVLQSSAYPLWHVQFAVLYKLGVPFAWAAAAVCAAYQMLCFLLAQRIVYLYLAPEANARLSTITALLLMFVTAVRIPSVNPGVFAGVGSPNAWQSPTYIVGLVSSLLCLPYAAHCVFAFFELREGAGEKGAALPWKQAAVLSALLLLSVLCDPAFPQAFLPAFGAYLLILWAANAKHPRFFLQMFLALLPAAAALLLQSLSSAGGVAVSPSLERLWLSARNLVLMAAFPLFVLLLVPRKETFRDPIAALCLLLAAASVLEAAVFLPADAGGTGVSWASMSAAFLLWVFMLPRFFNAVFAYRGQRRRLQEDARRGALSAASLARAQARHNLLSLGFLGGTVLWIWHLYSAGCYLYILFSTNGAL